jgi:hypothetical protein
VERFIRTLLETCAYAYPCAQERERAAALAPALDSYNRFRRDRALGGGRPTGAPALEARLTAKTDDFDCGLKRGESGSPSSGPAIGTRLAVTAKGTAGRYTRSHADARGASRAVA